MENKEVDKCNPFNLKNLADFLYFLYFCTGDFDKQTHFLKTDELSCAAAIAKTPKAWRPKTTFFFSTKAQAEKTTKV